MSDQITLTRRDTLLAATALAAVSTLVSEPPANAQQATTSTGGASYTFERGFPTKDAAQRARDDADFQRAMTAYRFWYPTVSAEGIFNGLREVGIKDNEAMMVQVTGPRHVMFTPNSDTPYGVAVIDVEEGPFVIDVPPGQFIGLADNHHQGWILDMGLPGPAGNKGGKHLVLPPDYTGEVPAGYFTGISTSLKVLGAFRSLPAGGDVKGALEGLRGVRIYPLSTAADPKPLRRLHNLNEINGRTWGAGPRSGLVPGNTPRSEPRLTRTHDRLRAVWRAELAENAVEVIPDGSRYSPCSLRSRTKARRNGSLATTSA